MQAKFLIAIHFHQPVGNFDHIIKNICSRCYEPFLDVLSGFPDIKMNFHFSGCLLEWLENNNTDLLKKIKDMVDSGQIEMIGGGFYEPILPSIPDEDKKRQINLLSRYIKDKFNYDPTGAWIAERVWEPGLPSILSDSGVKYLILDDTHFLYAGIKKEDTYGYYVTEDKGRTVAVFPSDKVLRYSIPFRMPQDCIGYMKGVAANAADPVFIYGDDGEKFGEWPGTFKWVYEEEWLKKFFEELISNKNWLKTEHISAFLKDHKPLGNVYLPTSSYEEMLEWALPCNVQEEYENVIAEIRSMGKEEYYKPYVRGGFWRNFLSKYPESNRMNKKMMYVSRKFKENEEKKILKGDYEDAEKSLLRGQCNCGYWHGVFGGLYLFHLREALYGNLIRCEKTMDEALHGNKDFLTADETDYDGNGCPEIIFENKDISVYVSPSEGGVIKELDSKKTCHNFLNVLSRRKEAYHRRIIEKVRNNEQSDIEDCKTIHDAIQVVDDNIEKHLVYDGYTRYSFMDRFMDPGAGIEPFINDSNYGNKNNYASYDHYKVTKLKTGVKCSMSNKMHIHDIPVSVSKDIKLLKKGPIIEMSYSIINDGMKEINFLLGSEFNFIMPFADDGRYTVVSNGSNENIGLKEVREINDINNIEISDADNKNFLRFIFSDRAGAWIFPIKTVSQSETAYELNYQGTCIVFLWNVVLKPGDKYASGMVLEMQ